jgi:hypothetical protein
MILWRIHRWHEVRWQPQPPLTLSWGNLPRSQGSLPPNGQQPQEEEGDDRQGGHQRAEDLILPGYFGKRRSLGCETVKQELRHKKYGLFEPRG